MDKQIAINEEKIRKIEEESKRLDEEDWTLQNFYLRLQTSIKWKKTTCLNFYNEMLLDGDFWQQQGEFKKMGDVVID
jgi:hypothetical protein